MARAQTRSMRVPSIAGPIILIAVGIIALLLITGRLNADQFWTVVGHYWPVLIIGLGLIALAEWAIDLRSGNAAVRRSSGGYIWLVVLLLFLGAGGAGWHHFWGPLRAQFGDDNDDFFNSLGQPQHNLDQPVLNTPIPANAQVQIQIPRGDVSISAGDSADSSIAVRAHQIAFTNSDSEASKIFASQKAHVTVSGNVVLVKVDSNNSGRTNLSITLPKTASVNVTSGHGAVTVAGVGGDVDADVQHGDFETTAIGGHVHAHLNGHGDFSAHEVKGDVTVDGNGGDLTLSDIHGKVIMEGDYTGDTHVERAEQSVRFHSSRTDFEVARLPGDMSLDGDSLHATQVVGPVRVILSRSKDIEMSQVAGDTHIEDKDARIELGMSGAYAVEVKNSKGDVEVSLPSNVGQTVDAHTHNGDIVSDFPLEISGDEDKTATGSIGKGGPKLEIATQHADVRIRKGGDATDPVISPSPSRATAGSKSATVPHLKAKGENTQTVTQ